MTDPRTPTLSPEAVEWLVSGEQGISSRALFNRLLLGRTDSRWLSNYPHDPDDFRRCELLLREVPGLRDSLWMMASEHPRWAALVRSWGRIVEAMEEEAPGVFERPPRTWRCERAYDLMVALGDPA